MAPLAVAAAVGLAGAISALAFARVAVRASRRKQARKTRAGHARVIIARLREQLLAVASDAGRGDDAGHEEVWERALASAVGAFHATAGCIYVPDAATGKLRRVRVLGLMPAYPLCGDIRAAVGSSDSAISRAAAIAQAWSGETECTPGEGAIGRVARTRRAEMIEGGSSAAPRVPALVLRSLLIAPLAGRDGALIAVLALANPVHGGEFSSEDLAAVDQD